jgi:ubiquinone/menaquinone biosynthesis C-methylase UbiE
MLVEAKAIFPQAKFLQAKAQTIPLKSDCLDLITAIGLIEYMSDAVPFLAEASRLLKKGGFLVMSFSPANVWTRMRAIFGHRVYAWNLVYRQVNKVG